MKTTITTDIDRYIKEALLTLDDLSFFTERTSRDIAFKNAEILEHWGDTRNNPNNVIEEDLLTVSSKPEEMQQYFSLMLAQIPKCSILNKYDERLEAYKERFGDKLAKEAEKLIDWLTTDLDALMCQLREVGTKYGLNNPYEETWLNELRETFEQTDTKQGAAEDTGQKPTRDGSDLDNMLKGELKTDEAITVFGRAIMAKLIVPDKGRLRWTKSNALLAYLGGRLYCGDKKEQDPITKEFVIKRGSEFFPNTGLNTLFGLKNLGQSRIQMEHLPKGYEEVDKLF